MAAVYEAVHVDVGKRVAVKILDSKLAGNDTVIERFHREARAAAAVNSPNICDVYDSGRLEDGRPYLVLELLEGESLYERLVREGQLRIADTVRILSQAGRGLARAHAAGIVHRDLKPENIFLHRNSEGEEIVKLVDFGLAKFHTKVTDNERLTREGAIFGTPLYMSPEQVSGQGQADHRSDLWALGCITFECLTGRPVWPVEKGMAYIFVQIVSDPIPVASSLRPDLPRSFDLWLTRALERDPALRFQSAQDMVVDLAAALGQDPSGLVSTPAILPSFPNGHVVVTDSRFMAPTAAEIAPTQPPPKPVDSGPERLPPTSTPQSKTLIVAGLGLVGLLAAGAGAFWWTRTPAESVVHAAASATANVPTLSAPQESFEHPPVVPSASAPVALPFWADAIRQGQLLIARRRTDEAVSLFERTTERSDHPALLTMLDHARIAAASTGPCVVAALGRPRPYELDQPARTAVALPTSSGALLAWTSGEPAHAFALPLDPQLQPIGPPVDLTPQHQQVGGVRLVRHTSGPVLVFSDGEGDRQGTWLRQLDEGGNPLADPVQITSHPGARGQPSAWPVGSDLWVAYTDRADGRATDVFVRRSSGGTLAEPVRVTAHGLPDRLDGKEASSPLLVFAGDRAITAFVRQTLRENEVVVHRPGTTKDLQAGKARWTPAEDGQGDAQVVSEARLKVSSPSLACDATTCFVAWKSQPRGSHLVAVEAESGEVLWRKTLASAGSDVVVATGPSGQGLVVWFGGGRLRAAVLKREGMGGASVLARVHGEQAAPSLVADREGGWLSAWTCFEGGRPEAFVVRLRCEE
jgi:serine/threonine-protein kinase